MVRAYLNRGKHGGLGTGYGIDERAALVLSLYDCAGRNFTAVGSKGFQYCFERPHHPLERVAVERRGAALSLTRRSGRCSSTPTAPAPRGGRSRAAPSSRRCASSSRSRASRSSAGASCCSSRRRRGHARCARSATPSTRRAGRVSRSRLAGRSSISRPPPRPMHKFRKRFQTDTRSYQSRSTSGSASSGTDARRVPRGWVCVAGVLPPTFLSTDSKNRHQSAP